MKTKIEWCDYWAGWISALIDGEGSLTIVKEKRPRFVAGVTFRPQLSISNRDRQLLEIAQQLIGGGSITKRSKDDCLQLTVSAKPLRLFLPKIKLITKEIRRLQLLEALSILERHVTRGRPRTAAELNILQGLYVEIRKQNGRCAI